MRRRALISALVTAGAISVTGLSGSVAYGAGDLEQGRWYLTQTGVQQAHDQGLTGKGIKIGIVDAPIDPQAPTLKNANITLPKGSQCETPDGKGHMPPTMTAEQAQLALDSEDGAVFKGDITHGTEVVTTAVSVAPGAQILLYTDKAFYGPDRPADLNWMLMCSGIPDPKATGILRAIKDGADIISLSADNGFSFELVKALRAADKAKVPVVVGLDNNGAQMDDNALTGQRGILGVRSMDVNGNLTFSDKNPSTNVSVVAPGEDMANIDVSGGRWVDTILSGNSFATPYVAGVLALAKQKYPDATGNQLLQSLTTNTDAQAHERFYDEEHRWGYGPVNVGRFLQADPSQYPDTNPLFVNPETGKVEVPRWKAEDGNVEIWTPGPEQSASPGATAKTQSSGGVGALVWVGVGGGVLVVAGVVTAIVLASRRRKQVAASRMMGPGPWPGPGQEGPGQW